MLRRGSFSRRWLAAWLSFAGLGALGMADPQIEVAFDHITHTNTPFLAGACLEDVNHEIYGGLDSQLLFGESFQEPPKSAGIRDFTAYGGRWQLTAEGVAVAAGPGDKMVYQPVELRDGVVTVALKFTGDQPGNAGLILHCSRPGVGADAFTGYEIALSPTGHFVLARHRQNFEPLQDVPCAVPRQQWIRLAVQIAGSTLAVSVDGHRITTYRDDTAPLSAGQIALRTWQADVSFRQLTWQRSGQPEMVPLIADKNWQGEVSGAWDACVAGTALGQWSLAARQPWVGRQSQALEFKNGTGLVGIENAGLNRQGIYLAGGRPYEGYVWVRPAGITHFQLALRGNETSPDLAVTNLTVTGTNWQRLDFQLAPAATDTHGRFRLALSQPGRLEVGYAFLQPGEWGRFAGLPVRRDVADALQNLGVKLLRYGGSMVNAPEYRWEKMIGPRAQRPPYRGTWYAESSNGWGILEFLNFCEAAGIVPVPDFNIDESPQDMADFLAYVNGPTNTCWGARRAADGHPQPYHLKHMELGNEEKVDAVYFQKFKALAECLWAQDPDLILTVGDFAYSRPFTQPMAITGADSGITNLLAQQQILALARKNQREVWFDVHVWTEDPQADQYLQGMLSYQAALESLAAGARFHVVVYELNANTHDQRRALANARATITLLANGRVPVITSANGLQVDGQNDNGWDQGLIFLNPAQVWIQPPGVVARLFNESFQPLAVACRRENLPATCLVTAARSQTGGIGVLYAVNWAGQAVTPELKWTGFPSGEPTITTAVLAAEPNAVNSAAHPEEFSSRAPRTVLMDENGRRKFTLPPHSFTVLRWSEPTKSP